MSAEPNTEMVSAVFIEPLDAVHAMESLESRGYARLEMNLIMEAKPLDSDSVGDQPGASEAPQQSPSDLVGMGVGGAVGTAIGAALATLAAVGLTLTVPPLGLIIAGPLVAALVGGGLGAAAGTVIGGYKGLPDLKAATYAEALAAGGVILGVIPHAGTEEVAALKDIFLQFNGQHLFHSDAEGP